VFIVVYSVNRLGPETFGYAFVWCEAILIYFKVAA